MHQSIAKKVTVIISSGGKQTRSSSSKFSSEHGSRTCKNWPFFSSCNPPQSAAKDNPVKLTPFYVFVDTNLSLATQSRK